MSDDYTRRKRAEDMKRKRNPMAREVLERKGPFSPKVIDPRKEKYRRQKLDPRNLEVDNEDYEIREED